MSKFPIEIPLVSTTTVTAVGEVTSTPVTALGGYRKAVVVFELTDAAADVDDTLDIYIDTRVCGVWVNAAHLPQVLGNGADSLKAVVVLGEGADLSEEPAWLADLDAGKVLPMLLGDALRVRYVVAKGANDDQSFTFSVRALMVP